MDTAAIVLEGHGLAPTPEPGLREMYFGTLEDAAIGDDPQMLELWEARDYTPVGAWHLEPHGPTRKGALPRW